MSKIEGEIEEYNGKTEWDNLEDKITDIILDSLPRAPMILTKLISQAKSNTIKEIEKIVDDELTPHGYVSDDPMIERIVQDIKIKHRDNILKQLGGK